jgi:hypothetical protein
MVALSERYKSATLEGKSARNPASIPGTSVAHLPAQMVREAEAASRKQIFLICRYALILATGAVAFVELGRDTSPVPVAILIIVALVSNVVLGQASPFSFFDAWLQAPVLVSDTALISVALLLSRASQESFFFFFFVLIMAAKLENLVTLGLGAICIGFASFLLTDPDPGWASPSLMRVPFMFATGIFFGYVVLPERTGEMNGFNGRPTVIPRPKPQLAKGRQPRALPIEQEVLSDVA